MRLTDTQLAARRANLLRERKTVEGDPLVQAILDRFPGAEITSVRRRYGNEGHQLPEPAGTQSGQDW